MSSFDSQLARMKSLMTYGREINETTKPNNVYTLEYSSKAADGKTYGIVKEFNKFYIKQAESGKELMAESYNYIGGIMNKKNYEYDSYNKALKNFELKLASINEAHEGNVNIETLDPFKKENVIIEGTEKMKNEIARQRQLMYNAAMLMGESKDYAVKGDGCECDTKQPEAKTGKRGDEDLTDAKVVEQDKVEGTDGLEKKVGPFAVDPTKTPDQLKEGKVCEKCGCNCEECSCGKVVNEDLSTDTDFDEGVDTGLNSEIGDGEPFEEKVNANLNEDLATDTDFDEGVPAFPQAGVGEADTDNNNDPFNKDVTATLTEGEEEVVDDVVTDVDGDEFDGEEIELDDEPAEEPVDDVEDVEDSIEDLEDEPEEAEEVDETDPEAVKAEIERLQGILDNLENTDDAEADAEYPEADDFEDVDTFDDEEDIDECGDYLMEAKNNLMKKIVRNVTSTILKEEELHDFGKHPGYRKKPFTTPRNGDDRNQWGRDWNDDSVHGEEPFGKEIGNGDPYNQLVNAVAKDVLYQLKHGDIDNKKKEQ